MSLKPFWNKLRIFLELTASITADLFFLILKLVKFNWSSWCWMLCCLIGRSGLQLLLLFLLLQKCPVLRCSWFRPASPNIWDRLVVVVVVDDVTWSLAHLHNWDFDFFTKILATLAVSLGPFAAGLGKGYSSPALASLQMQQHIASSASQHHNSR